VKLGIKLGGLVVEGGFFRVRTAVGIISYRKATDRWHNLLFDFDGDIPSNTNFDWREETPNGFHAVKLGQYSLKRARKELLESGVDTSYVELGYRRGYWFLETFTRPPKEIIRHLRFMRIERVARSIRQVNRIDVGKGRNFGRGLSVLLGR